MLQTFYNNFGFNGSLLIAFGLFIFFIFWIAGLAGLHLQEESSPKRKNLKMAVALLIPLYPFFWLITDMFIQRRKFKKNT
ncbi:MAG: hypothetical protein WD355_11865 [Balneolaceae bacterium]